MSGFLMQFSVCKGFNDVSLGRIFKANGLPVSQILIKKFKKMDLQNLVSENPCINITIAAGELFEFGRQIADQTAKSILARDEVKVYTRTEVIDKFKICAVSLWRWEKMGLIKSQKIGGRIYYSESEIKALMGQKGGLQ